MTRRITCTLWESPSQPRHPRSIESFLLAAERPTITGGDPAIRPQAQHHTIGAAHRGAAHLDPDHGARTMYDMYPREWGPSRHREPESQEALKSVQSGLDLRDNGGQRPDDN